MAGIIRYDDPLPIPVAANTNRKQPRNHGNRSELWLTASTTAEGKPGKVDGSLVQAATLAGSGAVTVSSRESVSSTPSVPTIMATNAPRVTLAPPYLSANQPPKGRAMDPTRAPRKA